MKSYYESIDPSYGAVRADFFRYLLMYKEGGIYMDLKVTFKNPLSDYLLPNDLYLLSHWDNREGESHQGWGMIFKELRDIPRGEFIMGVLISVPGHPFLRKIIHQVIKNIDNYNPYVHDIAFGGSLRLTGSVAYSLVIAEEIAKKENADLYREVEFVTDMGMEYHTSQAPQIVKTDYRKAMTPIIHNNNKWIASINKAYFFLLSWYRKKLVLKKQ